MGGLLSGQSKSKKSEVENRNGKVEKGGNRQADIVQAHCL
jgi:hypothetical protein